MRHSAYLIGFDVKPRHKLAGYSKIGISFSPSKRLAELQTSVPMPLKLIATWEFPSPEEAANFESACHRRYAAYCLSGEWFEVSFYEVEMFHREYVAHLSRHPA